jgi:hypothetical protein
MDSTIWFVVPAGLLVGFLIGLTGMGGGALMTPFLLIVMKMNPVAAVATDLMYASITKMVGGYQHYQHTDVELKKVAWMACGSLPASFVGARIILSFDKNQQMIEQTLPMILGVVLILVSLIIFARIFRFVGPKEYIELRWPSPPLLILVGAFGGLLVGLTSIGGGTVIMALMLLFFSIPLNVMVGLDVLHGAVLALFTALTYAVAGQTDWQIVGLLLIGSLPGVWLGAKAINHIDRRVVRGILSVLVMGAGIHLIIR